MGFVLSFEFLHSNSRDIWNRIVLSLKPATLRKKLSNVETSKSQLSLTTSWVLQTEWICFPWGTSTSNAGSNCSNTVHHLVVLQMQRIIQECFISHVHLWVEPVQHCRHAVTVKQGVRKACACTHITVPAVLYCTALYCTLCAQDLCHGLHR